MAKPKLALIPATQGSKLYSVLPSDGVGDFTFSRDTIATRINKDGLIETVASGVSRLNYPLIDGVVNGCPSHLLEPERLQLIQYSEAFDNASWSKINATIELNSTISPDGTLNASKIIDNSTNGYHRMTNAFSTPSSGNFTYSIFLKKGTLNTAQFQVFDGATAASALVDLENGTIESDGQGINHKIENYGNGWYRCSISGSYGGSTTTVYVYTKQKTPNYIGNEDYLYVWGAQFEAGSYPTSYIPNYGTALGVTRSAETANGAGDASTFNDSEGVLMAEISALSDLDDTRYVTLNEGTSSVNRLSIQYRNSGELRLYNGGTSTAQMIYRDTSLDLSEKIKIAIKYGTTSSSYKVYINGFSKTIESAFVATAMSGLNNLKFTDSNGSGNQFYGNTKQIQYFDSALNDSDLETITSWTSFTDLANGQLYTIE